MLYFVKKGKNKHSLPIIILKYTLPIFSFGFFGQIFLMFTTIFFCLNRESNTSPYLKCRPGHWFNKLKIIGGICIFLHILISFITNTLYYKPIFTPSESDLLKKSNSLPDIIFLFTKIIIITTFILDHDSESEHWAILSILVIVTGTNAYFTLVYKNRLNKVLLYLNNFFCLCLFSGFFILFISKIFKFLDFNGGIFLFSSCVVIISVFIIFFKNKEMNIILINYKNIYDPYEFSQYINNFYSIISNKNNSRNYTSIIKSLVVSIEENCINKDCPLKKYLINLNKGFDCEYLLLQFCEILFKYGISKFKDNNALKNDYSIFLSVYLNNKKKALIILKSIKDTIISLQVNYNIYRCYKLIENYSSSSLSINKNNSLFEYKENTLNLKIYIEKISLLYYEFLTLLYESKNQQVFNFEKINKIGIKIKKLIKKIEKCFNKIINIKTNNFEIIKFYSEFVENILLDEEKIEKCNIYRKLIYNNSFNEIHQKDFSNFSLEIFKEKFNLIYLIISTKKKFLGNIIDCSSNLSKIFGYQKSELIGNHINILIPRIFHQKHNKIVAQKTDENRLNFLEGLYKNRIYSPNLIDKDLFCISKSKFLIPLNIKIYFVNTEENELVYVAEIMKKTPPYYDLLKKIKDDSYKCCILTDQNFIIQSFTPNCINYLNLNFEDISSNYNILNSIKQFRNDYLSEINISSIESSSNLISTNIFSFKGTLRKSKINLNKNKKTLPYSKRQIIKNNIFNQKYFKKCKITWSHIKKNILKAIKKEKKNFRGGKSSISNNDDSLIMGENKLFCLLEMDLYMETKKIILDNELVGYYFYFSKIYNNEKNCFLDYNIEEKKDSSTFESKRIKKYQCIIKSDNQSQNPSPTNKKKKSYFYKSELVESNDNNKNNYIINRTTKRKKTLQNNYQRFSLKDEEKKYEKRGSKYSSNHKIPEINNDIIINEDFIPNSRTNFLFNLKNFSYELSEDIDNEKKLIENLKNESLDKITIYEKIKSIKNKKNKLSDIFESSDGEESSSESEENSNSDSNYKSSLILNSNSSDDKKLDNNSSKKEIGQINEKVEKVDENNQQQNIKNIDDNKNNYYKINLNKIIFMIYDFKKDVINDEHKNKNISKIEEILINSKKEYSINIGKEENYPFISYLNNNNIKKQGKNLNKNELNLKKNNTSLNNIAKDKSLEIQITDAINNYNDEVPIKKLKNLALISFFILAIIGLINFFYSLNFYSVIKELFNITKNSLDIKYDNNLSIYYIRELTLLNFDINEIEGRKYIKFPSKNKKNYIQLIRTKLSELFKDNQSLIKKIFSSTLNQSKNTTKYISEIIINVKYLSSNNNVGNIWYNIFTTLMQYNNDFYNLAFTNLKLEQNHTDVFNFIYNSFNAYGNAINLLYNLYNNELQNIGKLLKLISIISLIIIFLILISIYIFGIIYFISSNNKRVSYIKVFYSIHNEFLRNSILKCLGFINKFKSSEINKSNKEDNLNYNLEDSKSQIKNKINNINIDNKERDSINTNKKKNKNNKISNNNALFILFYGFFILLTYSYFIINCFYLFEIFKKSISTSKYFYNFIKCPNDLFHLYNVYREYLFDNTSIIYDMNPYQYLYKIENEIIEYITENNKNIDEYINQLLLSNKEVLIFLNKNYCNYCITDYFDTLEECMNKFGYILNLDFHNFISYFVEQIRIKKNIAKNIFETQNLIGNLTKYNVDDWIKIFKENKNKNYTFRLELFNNEILHSEINLLFFNLVLQNLQTNKNFLLGFINIDGENYYFTILIIIYLLSLTIIFYAFFIPMITFLNKQIYTSKNILSIIPVNILAYQSNIKSIVNFM